MSTLDELAGERIPSALRLFSWCIVLLLTVLLIWATQARLQEVATAPGEVVPQGQVKTIQHLEGGIIEEIFVQEGTRVKAGDPLVRLDITSSETKETELQVTLDGLQLKRARLLAEAHGGPPDFPKDVAERRPAAAQNELNSYNARVAEQESSIKGLQEQVKQKQSEIGQLQAQETTLKLQLKLAQQNLDIADNLVKDGLMSKLDHLAAQTEVEKLTGQLASVVQSIPGARSALGQAQESLTQSQLAFQRNALDELSGVELSIETTQEELTKAAAVSRRTLIQSPIDGIVKSLRFHTIGAVVRPGEALMDIVPTGDQLVIEARLSPRTSAMSRSARPRSSRSRPTTTSATAGCRPRSSWSRPTRIRTRTATPTSAWWRRPTAPTWAPSPATCRSPPAWRPPSTSTSATTR